MTIAAQFECLAFRVELFPQLGSPICHPFHFASFRPVCIPKSIPTSGPSVLEQDGHARLGRTVWIRNSRPCGRGRAFIGGFAGHLRYSGYSAR